jgi:hypothetical protein
MEYRHRELHQVEQMGVVYTMSNGFYEVLGVRNVNIHDAWSDDYWRKVRREDKTLPPSPCNMFRRFTDPLRMNRDTTTFRFDAMAVTNVGDIPQSDLNSVRPPKDSAARLTENDLLVQELLSRTNPFRYEYSVPVSLKELVDISTLFKIGAKSFASFVGSNYLNYKFGWVQFVRDVRTLHGITKTLESRIREFLSLTKKGGIRRKVNLSNKVFSYTESNRLVQSAWGTTIRANVAGRHQCSTHGTVRWRVRPGLELQLDRLSAFNAAVNAVFDLGVLDSQTVWNLVPFSWLVDYFVNLSDYFGGYLGEDVIEPYDICIVRNSSSRFSYKPSVVPSSVTITGSGRFGADEYDRDVCSRGSFPAVRADFLSRNQLLVIAALFASFKR